MQYTHSVQSAVGRVKEGLAVTFFGPEQKHFLLLGQQTRVPYPQERMGHASEVKRVQAKSPFFLRDPWPWEKTAFLLAWRSKKNWINLSDPPQCFSIWGTQAENSKWGIYFEAIVIMLILEKQLKQDIWNKCVLYIETTRSWKINWSAFFVPKTTNSSCSVYTGSVNARTD